MPAGSQICRAFKEHDLITCETKVHVVVSLVSSKMSEFCLELMSFDPPHETHSPPIGKHISQLGSTNTSFIGQDVEVNCNLANIIRL